MTYKLNTATVASLVSFAIAAVQIRNVDESWNVCLCVSVSRSSISLESYVLVDDLVLFQNPRNRSMNVQIHLAGIFHDGFLCI